MFRAVIQLTLSMRIIYTKNRLLTKRVDKVKWITAHNSGKPKMTFIHAKFNLKRENLGSRHCLTKCALENKLLSQNCLSLYHFSQEKLPHTLIQVIASTYSGKYVVPVFFSGPPCIVAVLWTLFQSCSNRELCCGHIHWRIAASRKSHVHVR